MSPHDPDPTWFLNALRGSSLVQVRFGKSRDQLEFSSDQTHLVELSTAVSLRMPPAEPPLRHQVGAAEPEALAALLTCLEETVTRAERTPQGLTLHFGPLAVLQVEIDPDRRESLMLRSHDPSEGILFLLTL
jgi:hypothetical protein